jgi:hypothetical protein
MAWPLRLLALALVAAAFPSTALGRGDQEMVLQDDPRLVHPRSEAELRESLTEIKSLGTDRVRVTVLWNLIAPNPRSESRPSFGDLGATDPRSYPPGVWDRYDRIVRIAGELDLGVLFTVSGPGPAWADRTRRGRAGITRPDAAAFGDFIEAVGKRYSGSWRDPEQAPAPQQASPTPPLPGETTPTQAPAVRRLPRVDHWSLYNEPNFPGWLMPQFSRRRPVSPHLYRGLVDAAWAGLQRSGHRDDTILLGETARFADPRRGSRIASNSVAPTLTFVRELYCLSSRYRPLRGRAARARGCPATGAGRARFRADHPGLFDAPGWAHHPYTLTREPNWHGHGRTDTVIASINRLGRVIDRSRRAWRSFRRPPLWVTEFGYETHPEPFRAVSFPRQAGWMSWAEFVAFRNPRVASFAQFLLRDDAPVRGRPSRSRRRWVTWQSGLRTASGGPKPALAEYRVPVYVAPQRPRGRVVRVFGAFRPAGDDARVPARIEFRGRGGWQVLRELTARGPRAYVNARVRVPGRGRVRLTYLAPGANERAASRGVLVRPR